MIPPRRYGEVVVARPNVLPAHLEHLEPAAELAVFRRTTLQADDPADDTLELLVLLPGPVIEEKHRAATPAEELSQREHLPAEAERGLGQVANL